MLPSPPPRWNSARRCRRCTALLAGIFLAAGCAARVTPPADPLDPRTVWLLAEPLHTGLLLPTGADARGPLVEYAYGEWSWYALGRTQSWRGVPAMLWPTDGALGRREVPGDPREDPVLRHRGSELFALEVPARAVAELTADLERTWKGGGTAVVNAASGLSFVPADPGYTFMHNCAHATAGWLRLLGCRVSRPLLLDSLRQR